MFLDSYVLGRRATDASGRTTQWRRSSTSVVRVAVLAVLTALVAVLGPAFSASAADRPHMEIVNGLSGPLRLDVMWASQNPYTGVFLWPDNNSLSQEFDLLDSHNGYFQIRARHSGQCLMLDWRGGTYVNGTRVIQYPSCSAGYAPAEWQERWVYPTTGSGFPVPVKLLVNRRTGRCLDAANAAGVTPPVQAVLQQWDCITSTTAWNVRNQDWHIVDPYYIPPIG